MNKESAIKILWEYMHLHHTLKPVSVIIALGSRDLSVAEHAAELYLNRYAPYLVCSGSGDIHNHLPGREQFVGTTEADVYADIAREAGVPEEALIIENKSNNTEDNITNSLKILKERNIEADSFILVHKPYMERRTYATAKVWLPDQEVLVTSPPIPLAEYHGNQNDEPEWWVHVMVGDMERIREYPKLGYLIPQDIPEEVIEAFEYMLSLGYTKRLIKK